MTTKSVYEYKSIGESLIELPTEYIKGSVEATGFTVEEVIGTNFILLTPEPEKDKVVEIFYTEKKRKTKTEQKQLTVANETMLALLQTVKNQQDRIEMLEKALDIRPTEKQLELAVRAITAEVNLIKGKLGLV